MGFQFDALTLPLGLAVFGDDGISQTDGNTLPLGLDHHLLADGNGRNRVVAFAIQDHGLGGDHARLPIDPLVRPDRAQRAQRFVLEQITGALAGGLMHPAVGGLLQPDARL